MDNSTSHLANQGQHLADKAADAVQGGVRNTQALVDETGNKLSGGAESLRGKTGPAIDRLTGEAKATAQQGFAAMNNAARQIRSTAAGASDSVINYTKENPVQALLLAAASGALAVALVRAVARSRD